MHPSPDHLVVYEMFGPRGEAVVTAACSLAADVDDVRCFWDMSDPDGSRIGFWTPDQAIIASFPWWDHADCDLARLPEGWMPLAPEPGVRYDDSEQGWFLSTTEHDGSVYVFESDLDSLLTTVAGTVDAIAGAAPGTIDVAGVEATWYRLPKPLFKQAWARPRVRLGGLWPAVVERWRAEAPAAIIYREQQSGGAGEEEAWT
jgi:hypothetical protein